jgi:hypothetical protein
MRRCIAIVILAGIAVGGCMPVRGTGEHFMSDSEVQGKDDGVCRSFGAAPGNSALC